MSSLVKSAEMDIGWGSLPLLPLRCILEHLSSEDALAAMSTCQHWRTAILLYEGHKETLKLNARQLEKSLLLSRLFRKHARKLHVYIDCGEEELERFMNYVLPQFFDTIKLTEVLFIGPSYIVQNQSVSIVKLKRIITESLVFKHLQSIEQLGLMGCAMDTAKNEKDRYIHKHIEYYSKPLSFSSAPSAADKLLSSGNIGMMMFSGIQHIIMDYEQISTETLITLSHLSVFSHLSMNVSVKRQQRLAPLDWPRLSAHYPNGLDVSVNIINMPYIRFQDVIQNVLVEGVALVSLKVLFCKTIHEPLLTHVTRMYKESLREVVWADFPQPGDASHRLLKRLRQRAEDMSSANVNPFILLCWQCEQLRRLVIHGYWVQQYDVLGFVRLRKTLEHLEISSLYSDRGRISNSIADSDLFRVLSVDAPRPVEKGFIEQVNEFTEFEWTPVSSKKLHPGLRVGSSAEQRTDYLVQEVSHSMGGLSYSL